MVNTASAFAAQVPHCEWKLDDVVHIDLNLRRNH
jgi:hypothetical protein